MSNGRKQIARVREVMTKQWDYLCDSSKDIQLEISSLVSAVKSRNVEEVRRLVKIEDVNWRDEDGYTLLHYAATKENIEILEILTENGAKFLLTGDHRTPLCIAIISSNTEAIKFFLDRGVDISYQDRNKNTYLHNFINNYGLNMIDMSILKLFLKSGADINAKNRYGVTPLHLAVQKGNYKLVEELVYNGANIRAKDNGGETPYKLSLDRVFDTKIKDFFDSQESIPDVKEVDE